MSHKGVEVSVSNEKEGMMPGFGSIPANGFKSLIDIFDGSKKYNAPGRGRATALLVMVAFLASCARSPVPESHLEPDNTRIERLVNDEDVIVDPNILATDQALNAAIEAQNNSESAVSYEARQYGSSEYNPTFSVSGIVEAGNGVIKTLAIAAGVDSSEIHELGNAPEGIHEVIYIIRLDGSREIHSFQSALDNNPSVSPGDTVRHQFLSQASLEDLQRRLPETIVSLN